MPINLSRDPEAVSDFLAGVQKGDMHQMLRASSRMRTSSANREWERFEALLRGQYVSADILPWPCVVEVGSTVFAIAGHREDAVFLKGRCVTLLEVTPEARARFLKPGFQHPYVKEGTTVLRMEGPFEGSGWIGRMATACRKA